MNPSNNTRLSWPANSLHAIIVLCVVAISLFAANSAFAKDYSFSWTANPEPVEGYKLYYKTGGDPVAPFGGTGATQGSSPIDVGKVTTFTISGLDENTAYHFALTAYNGSEESDYSDIVSVPESTTSAPPEISDPPVNSDPLNAVIAATGQTGETPYSLTFDGSQSTGPIDSYTWSFGDGETAIGVTATHTYQAEGTYTATLTIEDANGLTQQSSVVITVTASAEPPPPTQTPPDPVIPPPVAVGEDPLTVDYSFAWTANPEPVEGYKLYYKMDGEPGAPFDGTGATQGPSPIDVGKVTSFTISGLDKNTTYHFALTAYNGSEESDYSDIVSVPEPTTSNPPGNSDPLNAVITTSTQTGEAPFNLTFDGSQSTGSISSYAWSFGDGETATGITATHTYQSEGSYTATLAIVDANGLTHQSSVVITVTASAEPPTPTLTAPVPVISSSTAVGEAPLTVEFNGSGSSSAQPPITSYSWAFGDGATASGASVTHAFTAAGTYHTSLTVTDSAGLSAQTSTPVIVTAAAVIENEPPVASFVATPISGKAPLSVMLNAAGSTDPDGTISSYAWSLGDGSTANGTSTQHIFTEAGDFTVSLEVTDDKGDKAITAQVISVQPTDLIKLDLQEVQADHTWKKVTFSQPFTDPVIVAGPMGYVDSASASLRIRNVTSTDCEVRVEEWYDIRSPHSIESFNILIVEKGVYNLENGLKFEAGTFNGTTTFQELAFQQTYNVPPVVLTQVLTENEVATLTGRLQNGTTTSIEYKMQEREKNKQYHKPETVGYIAWEPGNGESNGMKYEVQHTSHNITSYWSDIPFQNLFSSKPYFLAGMQTYSEADTATVRMLDISAITAQVKIEEEQSKDVETSHTAEAVGYIAITPL